MFYKKTLSGLVLAAVAICWSDTPPLAHDVDDRIAASSSLDLDLALNHDSVVNGVAKAAVSLGVAAQAAASVRVVDEVDRGGVSEAFAAFDAYRAAVTAVSDSPAKSSVASAESLFSDRDHDDLVNTLIAEALGEGDKGMAAVASVIRNRAAARGKSPGDIVRQPKQFTGYEKPGVHVRKAMKDEAIRQRAKQVLDDVFNERLEDPTGGADHYHADYVSPPWARSMPRTAQIGRHLFYRSS